MASGEWSVVSGQWPVGASAPTGGKVELRFEREIARVTLAGVGRALRELPGVELRRLCFVRWLVERGRLGG